MISSGQTAYLTCPWLVLCPGFAVMLTVISFNLVGDGLRDALFPSGSGVSVGMSSERSASKPPRCTLLAA